jgi:hypothetical protein
MACVFTAAGHALAGICQRCYSVLQQSLVLSRYVKYHHCHHVQLLASYQYSFAVQIASYGNITKQAARLVRYVYNYYNNQLRDDTPKNRQEFCQSLFSIAFVPAMWDERMEK